MFSSGGLRLSKAHARQAAVSPQILKRHPSLQRATGVSHGAACQRRGLLCAAAARQSCPRCRACVSAWRLRLQRQPRGPLDSQPSQAGMHHLRLCSHCDRAYRLTLARTRGEETRASATRIRHPRLIDTQASDVDAAAGIRVRVRCHRPEHCLMRP